MPRQGGWMGTGIGTGWGVLTTGSVPAQEHAVASAQMCRSSPQAAQAGPTPAAQHRVPHTTDLQ